MRCPVCSQSGKPDLRSLLAAFLLGAMLFFVGGQLFSYYLTPVPFLKARIEKLETRNDELKKWFNPPPSPKKGEQKGIEF
jgi:hypothetical protein